MANILQKALKGLTTKHTFTSQSHDTTGLSIVGNFFGFLLGNQGYEQYTNAYGKNPLIYMIVSKIAKTTASIDRVVVDQVSNEVVENSQLSEDIKKPNAEQSQIDFYEEIYEYLLLTGNVYVHKIRSIGGMGDVHETLVTKNVEINENGIGEIVSYSYTLPNGASISYPAEDVLHIKMSNVVNVDGTNIKYGLSPLQAAWIVVESSNEKLQADAAIFKNRGIVGILTNDSDMAMLPTERARLQSEYDKEIGGSAKYNKIKVSTSKLKYIQTGMSPTDLKLLEGILSSLRLLCGVYGISSVLFNDNDNSTFNNVSEAKSSAFTDVYLPLANKVDTKLSAFMSDTEVIMVDLESIEEVQATTNGTIVAINTLDVQAQVKVISAMTRDEVRDMVGLDALTNGEGEELVGDGKTATDGQENN